MKPRLVRLGCLTAAVFVVILVAWAFLSGPRHPVALIRVVDAAGNPVAGAVITPDGVRTKPGSYSSGHYFWKSVPEWPVNDAVSTDVDGYARVSYPRYVFERIETGEISFSVRHPAYVPDRPFRTVTTRPPSGAPWRVWVDYLGNRLRRRAFVSRPDSVVLQKGAILLLSVRPDPAVAKDAPLFAQVSGQISAESSFWIRPKQGVVSTRQLAPGPQKVRAVQFDSNGWAWFSDVIGVTAVAGQTNEVVTDLKRGVLVHGKLDATVPRPIDNGRVVAHVWPPGGEPRDAPPQWHAWTAIRSDGTFDIGPLPAGVLEIVALCNGFVSTKGPGPSRQMRYPQKHVLGTNDVNITMGLEPTASLEVQVLDDQGNALKDARVSAWPNVLYGEWAATLLTGDCYNMADRIREGPAAKLGAWWLKVPDFNATSDASGLAVLRNLPVEVSEFGVEHARFALPAVVTPGGDKRRQAAVTLKAGQTNRVVIRLEPRDKSPIRHY